MVNVDWTATVPEDGTVEVEVTLPQVSFSHAECWTQTSKKASDCHGLRAQPWWTGGILKCVGTYAVDSGEVDFGGGSGGLIFGIIVIILLLVRPHLHFLKCVHFLKCACSLRLSRRAGRCWCRRVPLVPKAKRR